MIDDGGRPFRSEAPGEQMRSQISPLSPLRLLLATRPQHKQTQVGHAHTHTFYHFPLPFILTAVVKVAQPMEDQRSPGFSEDRRCSAESHLDTDKRSPAPGFFLLRARLFPHSSPSCHSEFCSSSQSSADIPDHMFQAGFRSLG